MFRSPQHLFAAAAVLMASLAGCASPKVPPPVDPVREQIVILQKQLLELQNAQIDTRKKVDEQAAVIDSLSGRLKVAEARQAAPPPPRLGQTQASKSPAASVKRTAKRKGKGKKKKPVRRQEP